MFALYLALLFSIASSHGVVAATSETTVPPCATPQHRQFNFWVGDWDVFDTATGQRAGRNTVNNLLNGCTVQEHWQGIGGDTGTSLNVYDTVDHRWHQTWVDNHGGLLELSGTFNAGKMLLIGRRTNRRGRNVIDRIVWIPEADGRVRQVWTASEDSGRVWHVVFDGTYVKRR